MPCSLFLLAASGAEWSPHNHASMPAAFQEATRAALLSCDSGSAHIPRLPQSVAEQIVGLAARPISAWMLQPGKTTVLD